MTKQDLTRRHLTLSKNLSYRRNYWNKISAGNRSFKEEAGISFLGGVTRGQLIDSPNGAAKKEYHAVQPRKPW
jgi:hypothetical protein